MNFTAFNIFQSLAIPAGQKLLLLHIAERKIHERICYRSNATYAKNIGQSLRSVAGNMSKCIKSGLVYRLSGKKLAVAFNLPEINDTKELEKKRYTTEDFRWALSLDVSPALKLALASMRFASRKTGICHLSDSEIADRAVVSLRTAKTARKIAHHYGIHVADARRRKKKKTKDYKAEITSSTQVSKSAAAVWNSIRDNFQKRDLSAFNFWVGKAQSVDLSTTNKLILSYTSTFMRDMTKQRYGHKIEKFGENAMPSLKGVKFIVAA